MFEAYWDAHKGNCVQLTFANERLSYFVKSKANNNGLWFVFEGLDDAIRDLHRLVGNAVVEDRHILVGTGSTQLFQAAAFALSKHQKIDASTAVVAEAPYYSCYPRAIEYYESRILHWAGDAKKYVSSSKESYIEIVTSPNNPCGAPRQAAVVDNGLGSNAAGFLVHDLAYYWPTFTPISAAADHDIMLFTLSKCTGHGGSRIGWAIVKELAIAQKMAQFIELNTIGVSQDAQVRATGLIRAIMKGYNSNSQLIKSLGPLDAAPAADHLVQPAAVAAAKDSGHDEELLLLQDLIPERQFFHFGKAMMEARWKGVRAALAGNQSVTVQDPSAPARCTFMGTTSTTNPAFIWLKSIKEPAEDCQHFLKSKLGILARAGEAFGVSNQYARVSLVGRQSEVAVLLHRLAALK
ncbi:unnamed protein product [Sphagnum troendelagicum]|uniref:Alliinase C-terminal domain-containing protein n=1 Tax=Sphagnum troendelagicum TaxID=128251 RepID=A0ABP0TK50_9BRYO